MKTAALLTCLLYAGTATTAWAQPNYYDSRARQNAEYKNLSNATNRAYSVPSSSSSPAPATRSSTTNSTSSPSCSSSTSSGSTPTGSGNSGYSNWGSGDRVRRQQQAGARNDALLDAHNAKQARFDELARDVEKTPANYERLMKLAAQAGFDEYTAGRILYQYSPEANGGSSPKTEVLPVYTSAADEYEDKAAYRFNNHNDPVMRAGIAADMVKNKPSYENYVRLARANHAAFLYGDADKAYARAIAMKPDNMQLYYEQAAALAMMGDAAGATASYQRALGSGQAFPGIHKQMAWAHFGQGNTAAALESAGAAARQDPADAGPTLLQAALTPAGPEREALLDKSAAQGAPRGAISAMLTSHAIKLQTAKDFAQSIIFLDLAVAAEPANPDLVELRYGTNKQLGRHKQADADERLLGQ